MMVDLHILKRLLERQIRMELQHRITRVSTDLRIENTHRVEAWI